MNLTYAELFAGAGGLSLGLETAGWQAVAHAEIEPHARAVLREHWPECRLDGDVAAINGADYAGVTLLSGGSPCQDLSVAGRRAGMTEGSGTRSSLYFEQVRIWNESGAPYFLWENVLGAFSSNDGRDFAAVLSAIVGAAVPVPADGWESAGVAAGPTGVAAWRVLDCQFFGPPQRRRRVFVLGARTGGVDPAEVLAVGEGLCGDSPAGAQAGQDAPRDARNRAGAAGEAGGRDVRGVGVAADAGGRAGGALAFQPGNLVRRAGAEPSEESFPTLGSEMTGDQHPHVLAVNISDGAGQLDRYDARGNGDGATVNTMAGDHQNRVIDYTAIVFQQNQRDEVRSLGTVAGALTGEPGMKQQNYVLATVLRNREGKPGGGKGPLLSAERSLTLGTGNDQVLFVTDGQANAAVAKNVALTLNSTNEQPYLVHPTLNTSHFGKHAGCNQHVGELAEILPAIGIPRRLMPIECERLMGWEDGFTAYGVSEDGTRYALSDTARYRLCGNGVASPVAAWIGFRLRLALSGAA